MKKSEKRKLKAIDKRWYRIAKRFDVWWNPIWSEVKLDVNKIVNWYWFDNSKGSGDKALHLIMWFLTNLALLRIFRFI